jgi:hypothetical protein
LRLAVGSGARVQVAFCVVSGALLAGFIALRNVQPFKFRDVRTVFIFWIIVVANMITLVTVGNMVRLEVVATAVAVMSEEQACALGLDNRAAR